MAVTGETPEAVCIPPARVETIFPDRALAGAYASRIAQYRALNPKIADVIRVDKAVPSRRLRSHDLTGPSSNQCGL